MTAADRVKLARILGMLLRLPVPSPRAKNSASRASWGCCCGWPPFPHLLKLAPRTCCDQWVREVPQSAR
jgi:hypothetical protein